MSRFIKILSVVIIVAGAGYAWWWFFGPGRHIYEVDVPIVGAPSDCTGDVRFAVIGDFGEAGRPEADVSAMVHSWDIDFITTAGDNNYPDGAAGTLEGNIGQYYHAYIHPYQGEYGPGAAENRFFPALGNHDWNTGSIQPYLDYFDLPGNERYYDVIRGPVHLFIIDSDINEPDGQTADSVQGQWLRAQLSASDSPWKLVLLHHAPYSSGGNHGDSPDLQWPFADWGADVVLAGHEHSYERIERDGIQHIINGLGGRKTIYPFGAPQEGSVVRYNQDYGAMLVTADDACINFTFYDRSDRLIDSVTLFGP
jgi:tartrate-resistant acid phosphatase type 5